MNPEELLQLSELRQMRREIQTAYAEAMEQEKRAAALERAIARGHIKASAYDHNNAPEKRQARIDEECGRRWKKYNERFSAYAQRVDQLYAEHGHKSRRWVEFDSPEARAAAAQNEKYLRLRGQYLSALNHGTREARIKALTECELRMRAELGEGAAAVFVRGLDPSNRAIYDQIRRDR